jgi:hypothetical protein
MLDISGTDRMLPRARTRREAVNAIHELQHPRD